MWIYTDIEIVGWSNSVSEPAFGTGSGGDASVKSKLINLMTSVRTLMRSMFPFSCIVRFLGRCRFRGAGGGGWESGLVVMGRREEDGR